jgi:hypothetical protein
MRFDTRNIRTLYRAVLVITVSRVILKCKLDLMGVQKVRWDRHETQPAGECTFFYGKGNENHDFFNT